MANLSEKIKVLNTDTGAVGWIKRRLFENPRFNRGILEEVPADQKPYTAALFKSRFEGEKLGVDVEDILNFDAAVEKFNTAEEEDVK